MDAASIKSRWWWARSQMNNIFADIKTYAFEGGWLLVCDIPPLAALLKVADASDIAAIEGFAVASRQAERLAWRIMLRSWATSNLQWRGEELEVEYSQLGAPTILNFPYNHISVSHCRSKVAVVISDGPCAVDIDSINRNFQSVAPRYLSPEEQALAQDTTMQAAMWCAKECLYKLSGRSALNLRDDIHVKDVDMQQGVIRGGILHDDVMLRTTMPDDEHIIVYYI